MSTPQQYLYFPESSTEATVRSDVWFAKRMVEVLVCEPEETNGESDRHIQILMTPGAAVHFAYKILEAATEES